MMPAVEVLLRYFVPGTLLTLPLVPRLTGHGPEQLSGSESALAVVAVLVLGYLVHQGYWLLVDVADFDRRILRRRLYRVLGQIVGNSDHRSLYLEWELWLHSQERERVGNRTARLWMLFDTSATTWLAAVLGALVLVSSTGREFDPLLLYALYVPVILGFSAISLLVWHRIQDWEEFVARRMFRAPSPASTAS